MRLLSGTLFHFLMAVAEVLCLHCDDCCSLCASALPLLAGSAAVRLWVCACPSCSGITYGSGARVRLIAIRFMCELGVMYISQLTTTVYCFLSIGLPTGVTQLSVGVFGGCLGCHCRRLLVVCPPVRGQAVACSPVSGAQVSAVYGDRVDCQSTGSFSRFHCPAETAL